MRQLNPRQHVLNIEFEIRVATNQMEVLVGDTRYAVQLAEAEYCRFEVAKSYAAVGSTDAVLEYLDWLKSGERVTQEMLLCLEALEMAVRMEQ